MESPITITLAYESEDNFPWILGDGLSIDMEKPGIAVEHLKLVALEIDADITFVRMPWKRCLYAMKANQVDGVFNVSFQTERMDMGVYPMLNGEVDISRRIAMNSYVFYKNKRSSLQWHGTNFSEQNLVIGTVLGYSVNRTLNIEGARVLKTSSSLKNLELLLINRIDVILDAPDKIDKFIHMDHKYKDVIKISPAYQVKPYYVMLSARFFNEHPELANALWNAVGKIRRSKEMEIIRLKYALTPSAPAIP